MRVLVTGSRKWTDRQTIRVALAEQWVLDPDGPFTVIHGACPTGADAIVDEFATVMNGAWRVERFPADWERYGKRAGYVRNAAMVAADPDVCLAFIYGKSRGATMCADLAEKAGIPVRRYVLAR